MKRLQIFYLFIFILRLNILFIHTSLRCNLYYIDMFFVQVIEFIYLKIKPLTQNSRLTTSLIINVLSKHVPDVAGGEGGWRYYHKLGL